MKNFVKTLIKLAFINTVSAFGVFGGIIALGKLFEFFEKRKQIKEFENVEFEDIIYDEEDEDEA